MSRTARFATLFVLAIVLVLPSLADAATLYRAIGGDCVIADEDIAADNYDTAGFGVKFKGSATGDIRALCNVEDPGSATWRSFRLSYDDPDGSGATYSIVAKLKYVDYGSNATTTVYTCTSAGSGVTYTNCDFSDFTPSADRMYFFEVTVSRSSTSSNPEFLSLLVFDT